MTYLASELISNAYYDSGIVSRELETVSGQQAQDGLAYLNQVLDEPRINSGLVPYESTYQFNGVVGQEQYSVSNLVKIDTAVFYIGSVRYPMVQSHRNDYFGSGRVENINSLPYSYFVERTLGGSDIYLYFKPDSTYLFEIHGSFSPTSVTLVTDLDLVYDKYFQTFLHFLLMERLCAGYNIPMPIEASRQLAKYYDLVKNSSKKLDMRMKKTSSLSQGNTLNYGQVNLGRGFTVRRGL